LVSENTRYFVAERMNSDEIRYTLADLKDVAFKANSELDTFVGQSAQLLWRPKWSTVPPLCDWEIDWFVRAYRDYSLFELTPRRGRPYAKWPQGCPRIDIAGGIMELGIDGKSLCHEFLVVWPSRKLHQHEYLTQFAVAGELFAVYKQLRDRLVAEKDHYAIDLAVLDEKLNPVIGAEVKVTENQHDTLVRGIRECRGRELPVYKCRLRVNDRKLGDHRKCCWIRDNPSVKYLWVRSAIRKDPALRFGKSELFEIIRADDGLFDLSGPDPLPDSDRDAILSKRNW
jgi:hypothetical protein